jgi:hypothetical protein
MIDPNAVQQRVVEMRQYEGKKGNFEQKKQIDESYT